MKKQKKKKQNLECKEKQPPKDSSHAKWKYCSFPSVRAIKTAGWAHLTHFFGWSDFEKLARSKSGQAFP